MGGEAAAAAAATHARRPGSFPITQLGWSWPPRRRARAVGGRARTSAQAEQGEAGAQVSSRGRRSARPLSARPAGVRSSAAS